MIVTCCICGETWDPASGEVIYRSLDRKWWCDDEHACTSRAARASAIASTRAAAGRASTLEQMQVALDEAWETLWREQGWDSSAPGSS